MILQELSKYLLKIEDVIQFSLRNNLNVHSYLGGKYGELYVLEQLWKHNPKIADERTQVKVPNPRSCDIILASSKKKLEIKWGKLHDEKDKMTSQTAGIPFWGWGFSEGKQFLKRKFDYAILLAAEKGGAKPDNIFVLKCDEMNQNTMGGKRKSVVTNKGSYYIEYSTNPDFYFERNWHKGKSDVETLLQDHLIHKTRWNKLVQNGEI